MKATPIQMFHPCSPDPSILIMLRLMSDTAWLLAQQTASSIRNQEEIHRMGGNVEATCQISDSLDTPASYERKAAYLLHLSAMKPEELVRLSPLSYEAITLAVPDPEPPATA